VPYTVDVVLISIASGVANESEQPGSIQYNNAYASESIDVGRVGVDLQTKNGFHLQRELAQISLAL